MLSLQTLRFSCSIANCLVCLWYQCSNYWRWFLEVVRLNYIPNLMQHLKQEYAADP